MFPGCGVADVPGPYPRRLTSADTAKGAIDGALRALLFESFAAWLRRKANGIALLIHATYPPSRWSLNNDHARHRRPVDSVRSSVSGRRSAATFTVEAASIRYGGTCSRQGPDFGSTDAMPHFNVPLVADCLEVSLRNSAQVRRRREFRASEQKRDQERQERLGELRRRFVAGPVPNGLLQPTGRPAARRCERTRATPGRPAVSFQALDDQPAS